MLSLLLLSWLYLIPVNWCVMPQVVELALPFCKVTGQSLTTLGRWVAAERNYVVTEQELLATVEALRVLRCYLLSGQQFSLVTDNKPNTVLETQPTLSRRQARWSGEFAAFPF